MFSARLCCLRPFGAIGLPPTFSGEAGKQPPIDRKISVTCPELSSAVSPPFNSQQAARGFYLVLLVGVRGGAGDGLTGMMSESGTGRMCSPLGFGLFSR